MPKRIGVIGLGNMGNPISRNLLNRGHDVVVFDIDRRRIDALTTLGAKAAASVQDLAQQADYALLSLSSLTVIEEVVLGKDGILSRARTGFTIIDTCTGSPQLSTRLAAEAGRRGVLYVDAPLSGTTPAAQAATLVVMVGGEAGMVADCREIFDSIGSKVVHCGPVGSGQAMKAVLALIVLVNQIADYEAMALGVKLGLDPEQIFDVVTSGAADNYIFRFKLDKILRRDFLPGGSIAVCDKDIQLVDEIARNAGVPLLLPGIAKQVYLAAKLAGMTDLDSSAIMTLYERVLGIEVHGKGEGLGGLA